MASSSPWAKKLDTKISALSATSSKESIQTLAKWIGFNRKHRDSFVAIFTDRLTATSSGNEMLPVYLAVIHQVLLLESGGNGNPGKWDKLSELRVALGEMMLNRLQSDVNGVFEAAAVRDKLTASVKEWDSVNAFGGPTLINQLKRELTKLSSSSKSTEEAATETKASPKKKEQEAAPKESTKATETTTAAAATSAAAAAEEKKTKTSDAMKETVKKPETTIAPLAEARAAKKTTGTKRKQPSSSATTTTTKAVTPSSTKTSNNNIAASSLSSTTYDFEAKGIPAAPVEMKELQDPCKSLATLQIARDLRNDSAQQIAALLAELPPATRKYIDESDGKKEVDISEDRARDLSIQTNDAALDLDISDQIANIRVFAGILQKQKSARQLLIHLLTKSRCQFGSNEAAEAFGNAQRAMGELEKRKQIIQDAMELEGAAVEDLEEEEKDGDNEDNDNKDNSELTLDWYKPPVEKKARTG